MKEITIDNCRHISDQGWTTQFPLINAVVCGHQAGKIFSADEFDFRTLFIIHKAAFSFTTLDQRSARANDFIDFIRLSPDVPDYFHIYDPDPSLTSLIGQNPESFGIKLRNRVQLKYLKKVVSLEQDAIEEPVVLVDAQNFHNLRSLGLDLGRKFWNSRDDFIANGFGVCILGRDGSPISLCYSACISDNVAEIDVITSPAYQRRGYAQKVVREFLRISVMRGITPNWDCFRENEGSLRTALKMGFEITHSYQFLSIFNKQKQL